MTDSRTSYEKSPDSKTRLEVPRVESGNGKHCHNKRMSAELTSRRSKDG